ncbi:MAG: division/cell wall cluster transcriptional repressor MraZ [Crocinitomicaceae bacterium]|nr:division/cell wall cluster transcriptional repressor MraZ [Crocinitomicaceae bacterium]
MANLVGEYECKLDAKGRFLFPVALRKQIASSTPERYEDGVFMVNKGFENCLTIYPMHEWDKVSSKISKLNLFKPKNRMFYRLFHQGAKELNLDKTNRLLIPTALMERIGLKKDIMLTAYNDRVEVWDREEYMALMNENMSDFADLADEVMGEIDDVDDK